MFPLSLLPPYFHLPLSLGAGGTPNRMSVTYFKRYRMEFDLRKQRLALRGLPLGYRLAAWTSELLDEHAEIKYESFRGELDGGIFHSLGELAGCYELMEGIASSVNFVPEATWLIEQTTTTSTPTFCGTIQGVKANPTFGAIQNVGVLPGHRGLGLGAALVAASLVGFQQVGLPHAYLEVTAQNVGAVRLYQRLGFRRTKTIYKSVEMAYS